MASASSDFDPAQLSPTQQEALQQYTQLTNQEPKDALPLLERSQWNVQIAITKFFDGEGPDPVAEAQAAQPIIPRTAGRHENLQESFYMPTGRVPRRDRTEPAPRIVPQPSTTYRAPWLLTLLFAPFQLGWRLFSTLFRPLWYILSLLPQSLRPRAVSNSITRGLRNTNGRKMLLPRDSAARFKREFEEEYGSNPLPWFEGGFAQAHDLAKKELKFLLVVLMSPEHDDTAPFARDVLLAPDVASFLSDPANNIILWGGNVLDSEAYIVSQEYNCTKFPFSVLISLAPKEGSTKMGVIKRLAGNVTESVYLGGIQSAMNKYTPDLEGLRAERRKKQLWRRWRATTIAPEPPASDKDVVRLAVKMPEETGAGRVIRRFAGDTTVEELYAFVECHDLLSKPADDSELDEKDGAPEGYDHSYSFRLASLMPREVYEPSKEKTLRETIGKSGNLIVEDVVEEEEEEAVDGSS
ncbi:UBX domain-containing protein 10 [Cytospora mali]|uniref:UBX domain-containing protein 10 n=1 Tax=Cytospora mali TaxID=578113 RepID=A0A194VFN8_CYTMA|nr:UBX domain-containing protein 10 [Valsa mali var. pyri (nom. inval.)]